MAEVGVNGVVVLCDEQDAGLLQEPSWRIIKGRVARIVKVDGQYAGIDIFHRIITECPAGVLIDHVNGNSLDNRRMNLRQCTHSENMRNRKVHSNNTSGVRGVYQDNSRKSTRPWRAQIRCDGHTYRLGRFATREEAEVARVAAELRLFDVFAPTLCR